MVTLASYGSLHGTVYRADGVTTVSGATVSAFGISTMTDTQGRYALAFVPLGPLVIVVATRRRAASGRAQS